MPLGLYISVPFCKTKCTYCNFSSDVFSRAVFDRYTARVCFEVEHARETAEQMGGLIEDAVDSVFLGGGTPTILQVAQLERFFVTISQNFELTTNAEITVECAPGTLSQAMVDALAGCGANRVSLGVQSFVDQEAASVGRLHKRQTVWDDIARLRAAEISNINVDLIAGLPHQTRESWEQSLGDLVETGVPHASVYMLEVDEDSRLGREVIAGGQKYHAHFVPDEDLTADMYEIACERLNDAGIVQYEISNFARSGWESRHNLKYWTRQPYLAFGMDAHSMLMVDGEGDGAKNCGNARPYDPGRARLPVVPKAHTDERFGTAESRALPGLHAIGEALPQPGNAGPRPSTKSFSDNRVSACDLDCVRFATADSLESYVAGAPLQQTLVSRHAALQETFFLGLRLTKGVDLGRVAAEFGKDAVADFSTVIAECAEAGLLEMQETFVRLTPRGRLLSNEVFERFISTEAEVVRGREFSGGSRGGAGPSALR
jgi:oxygen-independent coproporphyrinogen III oxidase